jgi:hypothetical protein
MRISLPASRRTRRGRLLRRSLAAIISSQVPVPPGPCKNDTAPFYVILSALSFADISPKTMDKE